MRSSLLLFALAGCAGTAKDTAGGDTAAAEPTFTRVQAEIYTPSCAFSSCHGGGSAAGGLDLSDGVAYDRTVGVASATYTSRTLIVPGDPTNSYLYQRCAAVADAGPPMPEGSSTGLDAERLQLLSDWITAGAKND